MFNKIKTYFFMFCFVSFLLSFFYFGCKSNSQKLKKKNNQNESSIENVIKISKTFQKTYVVRDVKIFRGIDDKNYKDVVVKISFTKYKNQTEIIENMKNAIIETYKSKKAPYRIEILAYNSNDDIGKNYTLGKATFVAKDKNQNLLEYKLTIEMNN